MANLSQDAINALLRGEEGASPSDQADNNAQIQEPVSDSESAGAHPIDEIEAQIIAFDKRDQYLTGEQIDTLGEVGNICMGTSATTMYTLLGRRVTITTPRVQVYTSAEVLSLYQTPFVIVNVEYTEGMDGKNLLILREYDTALITDLLMGGDGKIDPDNIELNELHLSAISEIMNQMIGSSATAMSNLMGFPVNISPPNAIWAAENTDVSEFLDGSDLVVKIDFEMEIEGVLKSRLLQLMSLETALFLCDNLGQALKNAVVAEPAAEASAPPTPAPQQAAPGPATATAQPQQQPPQPPYQQSPYQQQFDPYAQQPPYPYPPQYAQPYPPQYAQPQNIIDVKPASYPSFDPPDALHDMVSDNDIALISDIPLHVTVELGKTKKNISDVLEFGVGTVVVLDRMAGEMVDIIVNGKLIAKGEVVVIDDNYGVRITDIIRSPSQMNL